MYVCVLIYMYMKNIHTHTHTYIYTNTCVHTPTQFWAEFPQRLKPSPCCTYTHSYKQRTCSIYTYMPIFIHTNTYIYTHIYMYIPTQFWAESSQQLPPSQCCFDTYTQNKSCTVLCFSPLPLTLNLNPQPKPYYIPPILNFKPHFIQCSDLKPDPKP